MAASSVATRGANPCSRRRGWLAHGSGGMQLQRGAQTGVRPLLPLWTRDRAAKAPHFPNARRIPLALPASACTALPRSSPSPVFARFLRLPALYSDHTAAAPASYPVLYLSHTAPLVVMIHSHPHSVPGTSFRRFRGPVSWDRDALPVLLHWRPTPCTESLSDSQSFPSKLLYNCWQICHF